MSFPVGTRLKCAPGNTSGGAAPLVTTYQWELNGIPISGATANDYTTVATGSLTCVQTVTDNAAAVISAETVAETIVAVDVTAPTISSRTISANGTTLTLVLTESVTVANGTGFDLDASTTGSNVAATYASGSGSNTLVYTLASAIQAGETCDLDYTTVANGIQDAAGNDLASFTSAAVTNNSTQGAVTFLIDEGFESGVIPVGWTATVGSPIYNHTPAIAGSSSLKMPASTNAADCWLESITFSAAGAIHGKVRVRFDSLQVASGSPSIMQIRNGSNTYATWSLASGVKMRTLAFGGTSVDTVSTIIAATGYYVWFGYTPGSGANAVAYIAFSTTNSKPAPGSGGYAESTNGTRTIAPNKIILIGDYVNASSGHDGVFDSLQIAETTF